MVAMANATPGPDGARAIFGAIIGAGIVSMLLAPVMGKLLRFFPPVVTGSIIAVIGISLMRVGVSWATGAPAQFAQNVDVPKLVAMVDGAKASAASAAEAAAATGAAAPAMKLGPIPMVNNLNYGALDNLAIAGFVLVVILLLVKYGKGFIANIAVLLGIVAGGWQMGRAAVIARSRMAGGDSDPFWAAKLATTRFFADHFLTQAAGLAESVVAGAAGVLEIADDSF